MGGEHLRPWVDPDSPRPDWTVPQPLLCGASRYKYNGTVPPSTPRCELIVGHPNHSPGNRDLHVGRTPRGRWLTWENEPTPPLIVSPPAYTRKPSVSELKRRLATAERNLVEATAKRDTAASHLYAAQWRTRNK